MPQSIILFFHITKEIISIFEKFKERSTRPYFKQTILNKEILSYFKLFLVIAANVYVMIFKILKDSNLSFMYSISILKHLQIEKSLLMYDHHFL